MSTRPALIYGIALFGSSLLGLGCTGAIGSTSGSTGTGTGTAGSTGIGTGTGGTGTSGTAGATGVAGALRHRRGGKPRDRRRRNDRRPPGSQRRGPDARTPPDRARVRQHGARPARRHDVGGDRRRPRRGRRHQQQRVPVPTADPHRDDGRQQSADRGRDAGKERRHPVVDRPAMHAGERGRRGGLRQPVHHQLRSQGVQAAAGDRRGHRPHDAVPGGAHDARPRLQRGDRRAHRSHVAVARLRLSLGGRSRRDHPGRRARPARQLPGRESPVVFPVGLDAGHDAVRRGGRGTAVHARGHRDAGPAHAGGHQGPEHGRRLRRRPAGRQHPARCGRRIRRSTRCGTRI